MSGGAHISKISRKPGILASLDAKITVVPRLSDFRMIKIVQLPHLDAEPPIPFNLETRKEHVWTKGFLSAETVQTLKIYLRTLKIRKRPTPYLWTSNGKHPLDEDSFGMWLRKL